MPFSQKQIHLSYHFSSAAVGKKRTGGVRTSSTTNVSVSASFSAGLTNEENEYEDYEEIKTK